MSEGLGEMKGTMPGLMTGEEYFASQNVVSESEVQFSPQEQELIAKLIAEGKFAAEQMKQIQQESGFPKNGYYTLKIKMTPHELDMLVRSLKEHNISYTDLPDEAVSAIYILGLFDHFDSGATAVIPDIQREKGIVLESHPRGFHPDDIATIQRFHKDKDINGENKKGFIAGLIRKIGVAYNLLAVESLSPAERSVPAKNFQLKDLQLYCETIVNFVKQSGLEFEQLFPDVPIKLHIFIYKTVLAAVKENHLQDTVSEESGQSVDI